jgi:hypothetical protein
VAGADLFREKYCWMFDGGWCVLREKDYYVVVDKPSERVNV